MNNPRLGLIRIPARPSKNGVFQVPPAKNPWSYPILHWKPSRSTSNYKAIQRPLTAGREGRTERLADDKRRIHRRLAGRRSGDRWGDTGQPCLMVAQKK